MATLDGIKEPEGAESYPVYRYLDTVGDGTGDFDNIGDYSSADRVSMMTVRDDEIIFGHFLSIHIQDVGVYDPAKYGALVALTNGVVVSVFDKAGVEKLRITQNPVKDNGEWLHYGQGVIEAAGAGGMVQRVWIDLAGIVSDGLKLMPGESIRVTISDNMTGLVNHDFILHGARREL